MHAIVMYLPLPNWIFPFPYLSFSFLSLSPVITIPLQWFFFPRINRWKLSSYFLWSEVQSTISSFIFFLIKKKKWLHFFHYVFTFCIGNSFCSSEWIHKKYLLVCFVIICDVNILCELNLFVIIRWIEIYVFIFCFLFYVSCFVSTSCLYFGFRGLIFYFIVWHLDGS